jgi:hypothetical protein
VIAATSTLAIPAMLLAGHAQTGTGEVDVAVGEITARFVAGVPPLGMVRIEGPSPSPSAWDEPLTLPC